MSGKWIRDLQPTTALVDAARRVLAIRLEVVRDYLPLAIHEPDKDPEHVHQLRVGTRRAAAAVGVFAVCLPKKVRKSARARLQSIRSAAGAARDWDVHLLHLREWGKTPTERNQPGMDMLIGHALGERDQAQGHLNELAPDHPFDFDRFLAETTVAVRAPKEPDLQVLQDLARPTLTDRLQALQQALDADLSDYEHLHQVRIHGKRLRYRMEIFNCCFDETFRDVHYVKISEMQDLLGKANDSFVAVRRLRGLRDQLKKTMPSQWTRHRPCLDALIRHHTKRLSQTQASFHEWIGKWRECGGLESLCHAITNSAAVQ